MPRTVHMLAFGPPQTLPRSYGWGLQLRWAVPVSGLRASSEMVGRANISLGAADGIAIAIDMPPAVDGQRASWVGDDETQFEIRTLLVRAVLSRSWVSEIAETTDLAKEPIYVRAHSAALERIERLFDVIAMSSYRATPRLEAGLPIGLCQVFYGRKERSVKAFIGMTMYSRTAPPITRGSLPALVGPAKTAGTLDLAWRLFRRARQLANDGESLAEAIVAAVSALEVGITRALISKAASNSDEKKIE